MDATTTRWWDDCPLDVERLAWSSVSEARDAARRVAAARRSPVDVGSRPALVAASFTAIDHLRVDGVEPAGWAPMSGYFRTADGWVRLHANYPHHARALTRALGADTRDALAHAVLERTALGIEAAVTAENGIAAAVRTPDQWRAHPHGRHTADEPWASIEPGADRPALAPESGPLLAGVRVLDLTRVIAGPTCSQLLACLGADVLRIDPPATPELLDQHLSTGMAKRSTLLDLRTGRETLEGLLATADVVLLGYRPGALAGFGLDPDDLLDRHPRLVVAALSAWGDRGPWAQRRGFDSIVQAATGIATACGGPERPGALPVQALDHATGYLMAAHVLELLADARAGVVRISLLGAARTLLALPRRSDTAPAELLTPACHAATVAVDSPHGRLTLAPPPITLDSRTLEQPVGGYGQSQASWTAGASDTK